MGITIGTAFPACGSGSMIIQVDGVAVDESKWNDATHELGARLRFEHGCDGPYEFVLIQKRYHNPMEVGAVACDKKWIFSREMKGTQLGPWHARLTSAPSPAYRFASGANIQESPSTEPAQNETDYAPRNSSQGADTPSSDASDTSDVTPSDTAAASSNTEAGGSSSSAESAADTD